MAVPNPHSSEESGWEMPLHNRPALPNVVPMGLRLGARGGAAAALAALIFLSLPPSPASATFPGANGKIFYTSDASGYLDIWSMDPSGANKTDLTKSETWDERSAVSPNGQTVAYSSHVNHNDVGIYLMNADGSNGRTLIDDPELIEWDPAFTPDGASLLFSGQSMTNSGDVYTVPVAGGSPVDLTNNKAIDRDPEACAANGRIVFVSSRTGDNDIWVMDPNGANQTDLTKVSGESQEIQPVVVAGLLPHRLRQQPERRQVRGLRDGSERRQPDPDHIDHG